MSHTFSYEPHLCKKKIIIILHADNNYFKMFLMLAYVPLLAAAGISNKSTVEDRVGVLLLNYS